MSSDVLLRVQNTLILAGKGACGHLQYVHGGMRQSSGCRWLVEAQTHTNHRDQAGQRARSGAMHVKTGAFDPL